MTYGMSINIWYQIPDRHAQEMADLLDFRLFHSTIKQRYKVDYVTRAIYWEIRNCDDEIYFHCNRKLIWKCVLNDERIMEEDIRLNYIGARKTKPSYLK